ncbi:MAG: carboxypeptidase regulatory-like domain-containing protein [Gemmatimonadales bacterium]
MLGRAVSLWVAMLIPFASHGQAVTGNTSRIVGIVIDSIHASGLAGAEVLVSGVSSTITTDSLGRFSVDRLPPGTYQVGVFHPLLESLGLTLTTKPFAIGPDSTGVADLAIPSVATLAGRYCARQTDHARQAVVAGRVRDPDTEAPIRDATISLRWVDVMVSKETGITRTPHELTVNTDSAGFFRFCGVSDALDATVQAGRAGVWTGEVAISTTDAPFTFEDLALASSRDSWAKGSVRGNVRSVDDQPIAGARVEAPMWGAAIVTNPDGTFALESLPTGTQLIIVRRIGFEAARITVNITSHQPTELSVVLGPSAKIMDTVLVVARRNQTLERGGFFARQRSGWGRYFTHDEIDKRSPQYVSDLLKEVPGISVTRGAGGVVVGSSRITSILGGRRGGCSRIFVDGTEWRLIDPGDIDGFVSPNEVSGLEVYKPGTAPARYRGIEECLVILVWTEMPVKTKSD